MFGMETHQSVSRRTLLRSGAMGLTSLALADLFANDVSAHSTSGSKSPHFPAKAKQVIFIFLGGGPSHMDLFDPKPMLNKYAGQRLPESLVGNEMFSFIPPTSKALGSPFKFARHGECGAELSELLPNLAGVVDDLCIVRSMQTDEFNHGAAQFFMNSGFARMGRPSMGSWLSYGLGSENRDLPSYVVLSTGKPEGGDTIFSSGFLPSRHQPVKLRPGRDPVQYLSNPAGLSRADRRDVIDSVNRLNHFQLDVAGDPEITTRIAQYEMAFRMQVSVPELIDISQEPAHVLDRYGAESSKPGFARNCLMARRLIERGVRFVQVFDGGWDHHGNINRDLPKKCLETDQPVAALVADLKQRGLLDETLVIWGGEFGRTPMAQGQSDPKVAGRDHHKEAFSIWMAGGGIRGGYTHGSTDEFGLRANRDIVHVHDLHATVLHLLGIDHTKLTFKYQGREFRLTDVHGRVVRELLA